MLSSVNAKAETREVWGAVATMGTLAAYAGVAVAELVGFSNTMLANLMRAVEL